MSEQRIVASGRGCPANERASVACTSAILASKWMPELVFALSHGVRRFSELQKEAGGVNPRTLSARLDELEQVGIVHKNVFAETPPRTEYTLTDKGRDLVPILERMVEWGNKYNTPS